MMYFIQIFVFCAVLWSSRYHGWYDGYNGLAVNVVALLAAAVVTGAIDEIQQLPSRFSRLHDRIFGLKNEPRDDIACLPRSSWHVGDSTQQRSRLRIGEDPR